MVFYSQYLSDIGVDETKMSCLGLLQIAPITSVYGREKSYNFIHLTLQEFCAAWYISKLSTEEQVKVLKTYYYDNQFEMVWKFYSGITGLNNRQILNLMLPYKLATSESTKSRIVRLLYYVHEAHNNEVCKIVGDHCDGSFADLYPKYLQFVTYSFSNHKALLQVFGYFLIHYKGALRLIGLRDWRYITDTELTTIVNQLEKRWKLLNNVISDKLILKVSLERITSLSYFLLANLLAQQYPLVELYINEYFVHSTTFHFGSMTKFMELLTQSNVLCVLDISGNPIGFIGAARLAYCRNILIKDLRIRNCKLGPLEADLIGDMLAHNTSIKLIDLSNNKVEDEGVKKIVQRLKNGSTLQCIKLCDNNITAVGINHLITSKLLEMNTTLTSLDLSHNRLQYEDVCLFLNSLTITMEYIGLYGYKFIHKAIAATQAVHKAKSFGFACCIDDIEDPSSDITALIQQIVVYVTSEEVHYRMSKVISTIDNLKELKIYYIRRLSLQMAKDLSVCSVRSETVEIFIESKMTNIALEIVKLLISKTSIKKIKCYQRIPIIASSLKLQELLAEIPDTLEELTLPCTELFGTPQDLDDMLQEINKRRSTKDGSNPLQVNI